MFDNRPADGSVHYRTDSLGHLVALLPATCKVGVHQLAGGYLAQESAGVVRVSCRTCAENVDVDHFWAFHTGGRTPHRVEWDDAPYRGVRRVMVDHDRP